MEHTRLANAPKRIPLPSVAETTKRLEEWGVDLNVARRFDPSTVLGEVKGTVTEEHFTTLQDFLNQNTTPVYGRFEGMMPYHNDRLYFNVTRPDEVVVECAVSRPFVKRLNRVGALKEGSRMNLWGVPSGRFIHVRGVLPVDDVQGIRTYFHERGHISYRLREDKSIKA